MTQQPLLASIEDENDPRHVDADTALAGLGILAGLLERRRKWPWNLIQWTETGRYRAAVLGLRARLAVGIRTVDMPAAMIVCGPNVSLRGYRIPGYGRIAVMIEDMAVPADSPKRDVAAAVVEMAIRSIRAGMAGPDPVDVYGGLAATCAGIEPVPGSLGWRMPTPFSPPAHYMGADRHITAENDERIPHCVTIRIGALPSGHGFDVFITPFFVSAHHADDVIGALRDAPVLASAGVRA